MFKKKAIGRPKKIAPVTEPVQEEEVYEGEEGQEEEGEYEEEEEEAPKEFPKMPKPKTNSEPSPITRNEVLDLAEANASRGLELIRYARQLK